MRSIIGAIGCAAACSTQPSIPNLYGLADVATVDHADVATARRITRWSTLVPGCDAHDHLGLALGADVADRAGRETVLASYPQGLVVLDAGGHPIASTPGYPCEGSRDGIEMLAAGTAFGVPTIVVVGSTGDGANRWKWIGLFRVHGSRLDPTFTGIVESEHAGAIARGAIYVLPEALVYTPPGGEPALRVYDPTIRAYIAPGDRLDDHDAPDGDDAIAVN